MRYIPICILLGALYFPNLPIWLVIAILGFSSTWMLCCLLCPHTPLINIHYESHVTDPFDDFIIGPCESPFGNNPNADGGDFDYD